MSNSTSILDYLSRGTHAARPASPPIASGALAAYYETDTGNTFVWSGSAWVQINSSGGGGGGSMPGATLAQVSSMGRGTSGAVTATFGAAPTSGHLLLLVYSGWTNSGLVYPSGFSYLASFTQISNQRIDVLVKIAGASEPTSYSLSGVTDVANFIIYELSSWGEVVINMGNPSSPSSNVYATPAAQSLTTSSLTIATLEQDGSVGWTSVASGFTADNAVPASSNHYALFMHAAGSSAYGFNFPSATFSGALSSPAGATISIS